METDEMEIKIMGENVSRFKSIRNSWKSIISKILKSYNIIK